MDEGDILRALWFENYNLKNHSNKGHTPIPEYDGGTDPAGRRHTRKWDDWAAAIRNAGLDITEYVTAAFQGLSPSKPQDIVSQKAMSEFVARKAESKELRISWDSQEKQLIACVKLKQKVGKSMADAVDFALKNRAIPVDALVKYVFAIRNGRPADYLRDEARQVYLSKKIWYDRQVPERIPQEFKC